MVTLQFFHSLFFSSDKIVFCAGPPRQDEDNFKSKFEEFVNDNLISEVNKRDIGVDEEHKVSLDEEEFQNDNNQPEKTRDGTTIIKPSKSSFFIPLEK